MTKYLLFAALFLVALGATGCIVICAENAMPCKPATAESQDAAVCAIDTAGRLASLTGGSVLPSGWALTCGERTDNVDLLAETGME